MEDDAGGDLRVVQHAQRGGLRHVEDAHCVVHRRRGDELRLLGCSFVRLFGAMSPAVKEKKWKKGDGKRRKRGEETEKGEREGGARRRTVLGSKPQGETA